MRKQNQTRRISWSNPVSASRHTPRQLDRLGHCLDKGLETRRAGQQEIPGAGGPAASARRPVPCAGSAALFEQNDSGCLRALASVFPSFCSNSPRLSQRPVAGAHGHPAGHGENQERAKTETGLRALGLLRFPKTPAARTAPDRRPIRSLTLAHNQVGGQARFALDEAPPQFALGRSCGCRSLGLAPASLRPLGACATFANSAKVLPHSPEAGRRFGISECIEDKGSRSLGNAHKEAPLSCSVRWGGLRVRFSAGRRGKLLAWQNPRGLRALAHNRAGFAHVFPTAMLFLVRPIRTNSRSLSQPLFAQF